MLKSESETELLYCWKKEEGQMLASDYLTEVRQMVTLTNTWPKWLFWQKSQSRVSCMLRSGLSANQPQVGNGKLNLSSLERSYWQHYFS